MCWFWCLVCLLSSYSVDWPEWIFCYILSWWCSRLIHGMDEVVWNQSIIWLIQSLVCTLDSLISIHTLATFRATAKSINSHVYSIRFKRNAVTNHWQAERSNFGIKLEPGAHARAHVLFPMCCYFRLKHIYFWTFQFCLLLRLIRLFFYYYFATFVIGLLLFNVCSFVGPRYVHAFTYFRTPNNKIDGFTIHFSINMLHETARCDP